MRTKYKILGLGMGVLLHVGVSHAQTASGTNIQNLATIGYSLGGTPQPDIDATVDFVVDRMIVFTLTRVDGSPVVVNPNTNNNVLTFLLTNNGNDTQDFDLTAVNGAAPAGWGTDNINVSNIEFYRDVNGNNTYDAGTDDEDWVDELAAGASTRIFVISDVAAANDGDVAGIKLTAEAAVSGSAGVKGADEVATAAGTETAGSVDVVFGEGSGDGGDADEDGEIQRLSAYEVESADLVVTKTEAVISDPYTGATGPGVQAKHIPGATIRYTITITNNGSINATNVTFEDDLTALPLTYVANSIQVGPVGSLVAEDDNNAGADESDPDGADYDAGDEQINASIATITPAQSYVVQFDVTID